MWARKVVTLAFLTLSLTTITLGQQTINGAAAFERLKGLKGTWSIAGNGRSQTQRVATFRPGAGNRLTLDEAGQLTEFNLDHNKLALIHYCARGNQPRMRLEAADDRKLVFTMYDITNLSHPHAYHTTGLDVIFISDDRVDLLYRGTEGGRASTQTVQLTRKR